MSISFFSILWFVSSFLSFFLSFYLSIYLSFFLLPICKCLLIFSFLFSPPFHLNASFLSSVYFIDICCTYYKFYIFFIFSFLFSFSFFCYICFLFDNRHSSLCEQDCTKIHRPKIEKYWTYNKKKRGNVTHTKHIVESPVALWLKCWTATSS